MKTLKAIATWDISLDTTCPICKKYVNLLDDADFWDGKKLEIGEHGTRNSECVEVTCPECYGNFIIECEY